MAKKEVQARVVEAVGTTHVGYSKSDFQNAFASRFFDLTADIQRESEETWAKVLVEAPYREDEKFVDITDYDHPLRKRMAELNSSQYLRARMGDIRRALKREFAERGIS